MGPMGDGHRVSKRRAANGNRPTSLKRLVTCRPSDKGSQLSEEDLFKLLIHRMRIREENELAASGIQKQMQAHISELAEENEVLKSHVGILNTEVQKSQSQIKTHRAQIESWKQKLGKFKVFLNELGAEYQNLRKENLRLKDIKDSLDNEGKEIKSEIEDAKRRVSQVVDIVNEKRKHLSETENMITSMALGLRNAEERTKFIELRLFEEKRRSSILESYIQSSSRVQAKQLGLIRTDQLEMKSTIKSASDKLSQKLDASQTETLSTLRSTLENWALLVKEVKAELLKDKADVQQCSEIASKVSSWYVHSV